MEFLPPRVKTQFPTRGNAANDERIPIPIETAFFLEDAEQDSTKMNRYYFNFPAEWSTSNKGESIIGVRSMWLVSRRRRLEFTVKIYKIDKKKYADLGGDVNSNILELSKWKEKFLTTMEFAYYTEFRVIDWISNEGDLRGFFEAINSVFKKYISKGGTNFTQDDDDIANRDIQTDGYYDRDGFHEIMFSYKNKNNNQNKYGEFDEPYMCFYKICEYNDDFKEVFNIGTGPFQNRPDITDLYKKEIVFDNIWDRHPCKIYSSIGEQSLHNYIGDSHIYFNPIKYYKLNSSDQRFWIELYSATNYNVPIKLPKNESFVIEMQFLPFDKMLYV